MLTDFAAGAITAAVDARSVVFFDRPVDIRGEQEGGGLDPIRVTLMPGNNSDDSAWSSGAARFVRLSRSWSMPTPRRTSSRPEYLEWILRCGLAFLSTWGANPGTETAYTQITDVVLDAIEAADTDLEKRLAAGERVRGLECGLRRGRGRDDRPGGHDQTGAA